MVNLFAFAPADESLRLLSFIFGSMNGVIPLQGATVAGEVGLLGSMFKYFNFLVLTVAGLIIIYVTIMGVIYTAHEGEFMGRKWNNPWVPIRAVFGIAALVPAASGFSTVQIIMMWVIVQGIGVADTLWTTSLNAIQTLGSPYNQISAQEGGQTADGASVSDMGIDTQLKLYFTVLACNAAAKETRINPTNTKSGGYYCEKNNSSFCASTLPTFSPNKNVYTFGPGGECGQLTMCEQKKECADTNSKTCAGCRAQYAVMQSITTLFNNVAVQLEEADYSYRDFVANSYLQSNVDTNSDWNWIKSYCSTKSIGQGECCVTSAALNNPAFVNLLPNVCTASPDSTNFPAVNAGDNDVQNASSAAIDLYQQTLLKTYFPEDAAKSTIKIATKEYVQAIRESVISSATGSDASTLTEQFQSVNNSGWILAGGYYYFLGNQAKKELDATLPLIKVTGMKADAQQLKKYRNNGSAAGRLVGLTTGLDGDFTSDAASNTVNSVANNFKALGTSGISTNPIMQMQVAGYVMLLEATVLFVLIMLLVPLVVLGNLSPFALGTGISNSIGTGVMFMYLVAFPVLWGLIGILVALGGTLAIYIPLVPYIVFTMGAIGWLMAVIETMVAAPLVALGVLSPAGEHDLMGRAKPAIDMLFNVFLRPSLMLFGFFASMLLVTVVINLINMSFWGPVFRGIFGMGSDSTGKAAVAATFNPLAFIMFLAAYVYFVFAAVNRCFTLIHLLPQAVLGWIGGHGMPGGQQDASDALGKVQSGVSAAGSAAQSTGKEVAGAYQKAAQSEAKAGAADKKALKSAEVKKKDTED